MHFTISGLELIGTFQLTPTDNLIGLESAYSFTVTFLMKVTKGSRLSLANGLVLRGLHTAACCAFSLWGRSAWLISSSPIPPGVSPDNLEICGYPLCPPGDQCLWMG